MKTKLYLVVAAAFVAALAYGFTAPSGKPIALAVKVIRDVSAKTENVDWSAAKVGEALYSDDFVRTGAKSIAIVKFLDNSLLRVREGSELQLIGADVDGKFTKTVHINRGEFSFDIQKQDNEGFTFSSPTSVAAIRGTSGTLNHNDNGSDEVIVLDGLVSLLNSVSQKTQNVAGGQTGISNPDGSITVYQSTPAEQANAQGQVNSAHGSGTEKELDLQMKDQQGNLKTLKIKYKD
jgi:hypothetical protein